MNSEQPLPCRKRLPHEIPIWVSNGAVYFVTICTVPKGVNQLAVPETARMIRKSMSYQMNRGIWWIHLLLAMPDHLHVLLSFHQEHGMKKSISDWKHYMAKQAKIRWQRDFFDHRLRKDESSVEKAAYIRMNPVRAGLAKHPDDWPYVWTFDKE